MKRAAIFLHGNRPDESHIKSQMKKTDHIICADGGTQYALEAGLIPDIVLGDFDSLTPKFQKRLKELNIPLQEFPRDKDATDSELAISHAIKKGFRDLFIFAAFGTRIDHFLANIDFLSIKAKEGIKITLIDNHQTVYFISYQQEIKGKIGDTLSLIPLGGNATGIFTRNLKWPLYNDTLKWGETRGVSNVFTAKKVTVSLEKGVLLAVHSTYDH